MKIEENVPLAPLTSLRLGGAARYLARCTCVEDLREALAWARARALAVHVLGGGSNTIFDDAGFAGLVIRVALVGVVIEPEATSATVYAAAGEDWDGLVRQSLEADLVGLECLSGIPGLVGATPIQNVGAYGQEVAEAIVEVQAIERDTGDEVCFAGSECGFAYRTSRFKVADRRRFVITRVVYQLPRGQRPEIRYPELGRQLERDGIDVEALGPGRPAGSAVRDAVLELRRSKSMVLDEADANTRSAGSFFLNPVLSEDEVADVRRRWQARGGAADEVPVYPVGDGVCRVPAAWLVERAGFARGTRRGDAAISDNHALALVNRGQRTADLLALADEVVTGVRECFGVCLEREPVYVPALGAGTEETR